MKQGSPIRRKGTKKGTKRKRANTKAPEPKEKAEEKAEDHHDLFGTDELDYLNKMRKTPDASTPSIHKIPSESISALLESQESIFGPADEPRLLLHRLNPPDLDCLKSFAEIKETIVEVADTVIKEVVAGTGFDLNFSMADCRNDETMADVVNGLAGDGSNLSALEDHETATTRVAMQLVLIQVELQALLGLICGRLHIYIRPNGRIAIWGILPGKLRKFYCIGVIILYNLPNRVADFDIAEGYDYMVR
jgi:hypothetical protein